MIGMLVVLALSQGQDFSWSGAMAEGRRLTVRNVIGDVRIEPASGATASVTGTKRAGRYGDPEDVVVRQVETREGVVICVLYPGSRASEGDCDQDEDSYPGRHQPNDTRVDFVVRAPAGVHLTAGTVSGEVTGRGLRGDVEARSVSGDVRLADVTGRVVEAQTVSGDVVLSGIQASDVSAATVSGDVQFSGAVRPKGSYDLKTLSGDVIMQIPPGAGAEITGWTFSGDFSSTLPLTTRATSKYTSQKRVTGIIGDGSARIWVESFSGDVELRSGNR